MTPEDAFMQAIRAEPDDDSVRLIYADWLQEQNEPHLVDRGEFIRLQCESASLAPDDPGQGEMERRARQLLERHLEAWVSPLRNLIGLGREIWMRGEQPVSSVKRFKRGFVEALTLPVSTFLEQAEELFQLTPLRRVSLTGGSGRAKAFAASRFLTYLEVVEFIDYHVDPICADDMRVLAGSPHLTRLRVLDLYRNNLGDVGVEALVKAPWLGTLRTLNLGDNGLSDVGVRALAQTPALAGLTTLGLSRNWITDSGARALANSPNLAGLGQLNLDLNRLTSAGIASLQVSPHLKGITVLSMAGNPGSET
jgi:uncharacterized protein (TIGR02996 family)